MKTFVRDEPVFFPETTAAPGFPWRCYIWEGEDRLLFATIWGRTESDVVAKATRLIQANP
jgi:hypothetical protein